MEKKSISPKEAMSMNRADRRALAKFNGIKKIPSIINMPKPKPPEVKKIDKFFNNVFNK